MVFIDLENVYDRVPRKILWRALEKKVVHIAYIHTIKDMYDKATTNIISQREVIEDFPIKVDLYQRLSLSPYLFTLVLNVLTRQI